MYLLLNLVFLALEGVTNPEQGGALRVTLFVFVAVHFIRFVHLSA
jgi:hypothetical protein